MICSVTRKSRHSPSAQAGSGGAAWSTMVHSAERVPFPLATISTRRAWQGHPIREAVVTSQDLPDPGNQVAELGEGAINLRHLSCNVLAREKGAFVVRDPVLSGLMLFGGLRTVIRMGEKPRPPDIVQRVVDAFLWCADPVGSVCV